MYTYIGVYRYRLTGESAGVDWVIQVYMGVYRSRDNPG